MSTEFGRLLAEVLHSMDSGAVFEKLKAVMNIYEHNLKLEAHIVELETENAMLKQLPQPIKFWSDEKKQTYKINESRTVKSGSEECGE